MITLCGPHLSPLCRTATPLSHPLPGPSFPSFPVSMPLAYSLIHTHCGAWCGSAAHHQSRSSTSDKAFPLVDRFATSATRATKYCLHMSLFALSFLPFTPYSISRIGVYLHQPSEVQPLRYHKWQFAAKRWVAFANATPTLLSHPAKFSCNLLAGLSPSSQEDCSHLTLSRAGFRPSQLPSL